MSDQKEAVVTTMDDLMRMVNSDFPEMDLPVESPTDENEESNSEELSQEQTEVQPDTEQVNDTPADEEVDEYVPDYSYNVKGEEMQFDERFQTVVKSKEDEEYIRELYTKAGGLDSYKDKYSSIEEEAKTYQDSLVEAEERLDKSQSFYKNMVADRDNGDWRSVVSAIGYSEDDILKHALEIAAEREMPDDQRRAAATSRSVMEQAKLNDAKIKEQEVRLQAYEESITNQTAMEDHQARIAEQTQALDVSIETNHADLKARMAELGLDLNAEVINTGRGMTLNNKGIEPSIDDAINATISKFSKLSAQPQAPAKQVVRKETLPNISGSNSNSIDSTPSTLGDLQKELDKLRTVKL